MKHNLSILSLAICSWCPYGSAQAMDKITSREREHHRNDMDSTEATFLERTGLIGPKEKSKAAMSRNSSDNTKAPFAYPILRYYLPNRSNRSLTTLVDTGTSTVATGTSTPGIGEDILNFLMDFTPNEDDPIFGTSVSMSDDGDIIAIVGSVVVDIEADTYKSFAAARDVNSGELVADPIFTETNDHPAVMQVRLSGNGQRFAVGSLHYPGPSGNFPNLVSGVQVYDLEVTVDEAGTTTKEWVPLGNFIPGGILGDIPTDSIAISLSFTGDSIAVGSRNFDGGKGRADLFELSEDQSTWVNKLSFIGDNNEKFEGSSVAVDKDGDCFATGATGYDSFIDHRKGSVRVFSKDGAQVGNTIVGESEMDECGSSVSLGKRSETVFRLSVGATFNDPTQDLVDAGHVRIFEINTETDTIWGQVGTDIDGTKGLTLNFEEELFHIGDYTGFSLDMSHDGERIVVGSPFYSETRESGYYSGKMAAFVIDEEETDTDDWEQFGEAVIGAEIATSSGFSVALARAGTNVIIGTGGSDGDSTGEVGVYLATQVSESPSLAPSLSSQPSMAPSESPSFAPSVSFEPSMAPSTYSFRTFSIVSSYSKFFDLDSTRDWCLKTRTITPDSPLQVRPCETNVHKGRWYYENLKIKLRRETETEDEFCIKDEGRQLFLKNCQDIVASEFFFGEEDGTISVMKNGKTLYFGVDTLKVFSRIRLFGSGNLNSSYNKWSVMYEGPSNAPSESP